MMKEFWDDETGASKCVFEREWEQMRVWAWVRASAHTKNQIGNKSRKHDVMPEHVVAIAITRQTIVPTRRDCQWWRREDSPIAVTFRFKETTLLMVGDCRLFFVGVAVAVSGWWTPEWKRVWQQPAELIEGTGGRDGPFPGLSQRAANENRWLSAGAAAHSFVGHFGEEKSDNYGCGQVDEWKWSTSRRRRSSRHRRRQRPSHKLFAKSDKMDVKTKTTATLKRLVGVDIDVLRLDCKWKSRQGVKTLKFASKRSLEMQNKLSAKTTRKKKH